MTFSHWLRFSFKKKKAWRGGGSGRYRLLWTSLWWCSKDYIKKKDLQFFRNKKRTLKKKKQYIFEVEKCWILQPEEEVKGNTFFLTVHVGLARFVCLCSPPPHHHLMIYDDYDYDYDDYSMTPTPTTTTMSTTTTRRLGLNDLTQGNHIQHGDGTASPLWRSKGVITRGLWKKSINAMTSEEDEYRPMQTHISFALFPNI